MAASVEHREIGLPTAAHGNARLRGHRLPLVTGLLALVALTLTGLVWVDHESTALERTVAVGHFPWFSALVVPRDRFFVANSSDGTVSILDTRAGRLLRTVPVGGQPGQNITALVADARSGHVFVATSDNVLTTLDDHSGARVRALSVFPCLSGLAVDGRTAHVFAGDCLDTTVRMIDAHSGRILVTIAVGGQPREIAVDEQTGRVFVAETGGGLSVLDATSGRLLRAFALGAQLCLFCTPSLPRGPMLVTEGGGGPPMQVYVLDATTARLLRTVTTGLDSYDRVMDPRTGQVFLVGGPTGASATSSPFGGPGRVVVLDGYTGRVVRRLSLGAMPGAVAVDPRRHRLLLGMIGPVDGMGQPTGMGSVEVRDERSLRVLRTVPAGIIPWTITVDPRTDRAFVINANIAMSSNGTFLPTHVRLPEGVWQATERWLKERLPWLPLHPGAPRVATTTGTVTVLDLARL